PRPCASPRRCYISVNRGREPPVSDALDANPAMAGDPDEQRHEPGGERDDNDRPRARHVEKLDPSEAEHTREQEAKRLLGNREREPAADQAARDGAEEEPAEDAEIDVSGRPARRSRDA